ESTTTEIGQAGGSALSADGKFTLEIAAGSLSRPTRIVILTRPTESLLPSQLTRAYEVQVNELVLGAAVQVSLRPGAAPAGRSALSRIDGAIPIELSDYAILRGENWVRGLVQGLTPGVFALFDAPLEAACAARACGEP